MDMSEKNEIPAATALDLAQVCTLSADGLSERLAWIRDEILPHARHTERLDRGLAWELEAARGLAEKLDHLIALERECCSGIVFERAASATPGRVRLEVRGIDPDAEVFRALIPSTTRAHGKASRLAKAAVVGALASFFLCCLVPLAAVGLVGSLAMPLYALDRPGFLLGTALAVGAGTWWWLGRRRASAQPGSIRSACESGC